MAMDEKIFRDFHFHLFKFQRLTSNTLIWTSNMRHTHTHIDILTLTQEVELHRVMAVKAQ